MALFKKSKRESFENRLVYAPPNPVTNSFSYVKEALKGMITKKEIRFPKDLGEEHPFDFFKMELLVKRYGLLSAIVDKHIDFMLAGGIGVESEDENAKQIIEVFMRDFNFDSIVRKWLREGFIKGTGFLELGVGEDENIDATKVLNSNSIFVKRDVFGEILKYRQYVKPFKDFKEESKDLEEFEPGEIASLSINVYGDEFYGRGLINPMLCLINDLLCSRQEMHTIMKRKSNNPFIFLMGDKATKDYPDKGEMEDLGGKLEALNNKNEWVLTDYVKPMTLDFGNLGDKFEFIIENDMEMIYTAAQTPAFLMGKASIPEGLANNQMKAWLFRIQSLREEVEKVIEEEIFKRVLNANGIQEHVEIVWGMPSQEEKNEKIKLTNELIKNPFINPVLRAELEQEIADLYDIEDAEEGKERKKEENRGQPIVPEQEANEHIFSSAQMEEMRNMTVQEWVNFNYKKYSDDVLAVTNSDGFVDLKSKTKLDVKAGMLTSNEIEKLRTTLYDAFDDNLTIKDIESSLNKRIDFKDRLVMKDGKIMTKKGNPVLAVGKAKRAINIARTETIRLSNLGAIKNYKKGGITKVRWYAPISERTCPECESLNGQIFNINDAVQPPLHPMCRCTLSPVVE